MDPTHVRSSKRRLGALISLALALASAGGAACSTPGVSSSAGEGAGGAGGADLPGAGGTGPGAGGAAGGIGQATVDAAPTFTFTVPQGQDAAPSDANCGFQKHALERIPAELLLVLDRSKTLTAKVNMTSTVTRFAEVVAAVDEVVKNTDSFLSWGLKTFPTTSGCSVSDAMDVEVGPMNYAAMARRFGMTTPNTGESGTPMQTALRKAFAHMKGRTTKNPKYLVLATDGLPKCRMNINGAGDLAGTMAALAEIAAAGVPTFIIGIATEGTESHAALNMLADAGGQPRTDPAAKYYPVTNRQDLVAALNAITVKIGSCTFPLGSEPPSPKDVAVNLNGKRITRDTNDGWEYGADGKAVELRGPACDAVKASAAANVEIIFGCPDVVIP
jgi:hypothetical protein